jgi:hypothetical protein
LEKLIARIPAFLFALAGLFVDLPHKPDLQALSLNCWSGCTHATAQTNNGVNFPEILNEVKYPELNEMSLF